MTDQLSDVRFVVALATLKRTLRAHASDAVDQFEKATGITPRGIEIEMTDVTTHNDAARRYVVANVRVRFGDL